MRRLRRILKQDGKTVIVAMDHGQGLPVNPALDNTGAVLEKIVAGGADAMIVTYGIAREFATVLQDVGLIVRIDGGGTMFSKKDAYSRLLFSIEDALRIGADAVVCMGFPGIYYEHESVELLCRAVAEAKSWGMPVVAEMLPGGFGPEPPKTVENLTLAARLGCECGADIIKTAYAGEGTEFKKVVDASFKPVVVLGGAATKDMASLFGCLRSAMDVGAAGVAIGRNVWNHPCPDRVTTALCALVHDNIPAEEALQGL